MSGIEQASAARRRSRTPSSLGRQDRRTRRECAPHHTPHTRAAPPTSTPSTHTHLHTHARSTHKHNSHPHNHIHTNLTHSMSEAVSPRRGARRWRTTPTVAACSAVALPTLTFAPRPSGLVLVRVRPVASDRQCGSHLGPPDRKRSQVLFPYQHGTLLSHALPHVSCRALFVIAALYVDVPLCCDAQMQRRRGGYNWQHTCTIHGSVLACVLVLECGVPAWELGPAPKNHPRFLLFSPHHGANLLFCPAPLLRKKIEEGGTNQKEIALLRMK